LQICKGRRKEGKTGGKEGGREGERGRKERGRKERRKEDRLLSLCFGCDFLLHSCRYSECCLMGRAHMITQGRGKEPMLEI
jgi:hypothetical protein